MKKIVIYTLACVLCAVMVITGCTKNELKLSAGYTETVGVARLKVVHAMPFALNPNIQVALNGERVSSLITYCTPFPGGGLNTGGSSQPDYLAALVGANAIKLSTPSFNTNQDSVLRFAGSVVLEADKAYTAFVTDTAANATSVLVTDNINLPDSGKSNYRFVNLIPNVAAIDLYYNNVIVASNIPYKGSSNPFTLQVIGATANWAIRPAGAAATSTALATYANLIPNQRSFNVFCRGYSGATGTRAPAISLMFLR